jgi:hypothetical protein
MADIYSKDGEFDFQKSIFDLNNERLATEREIQIDSHIKAIANETISTNLRPKIIAIDGRQEETPKGKIFSDLLNDVILGVATEDFLINDFMLLKSRGIVSDSFLVGNIDDPVYANSNGELSLEHSNCKIGKLIANGKVFLNIGKESSDNDLRLTYDFITQSQSLAGTLRLFSYRKNFVEVDPPSGETGNYYYSLIYAQNKFLGVSSDGTNRVIYSEDLGRTWETAIASSMSSWRSVTYGNGLYVAVANAGVNRIMISSDGINWNNSVAPTISTWISVAYGDGLFVAVASSGQQRIMSSADGINWTSYTYAFKSWNSIAYGNGFFVAISTDGYSLKIPSTNTNDWILTASPETNLRNLTFTSFDNYFYAITPTTAIKSADGISWIGGYGDANMNGLLFATNGRIIAKVYSANLVMTRLTTIYHDPEEVDYSFVNTVAAWAISPDGAIVILTGGASNKYWRSAIL